MEPNTRAAHTDAAANASTPNALDASQLPAPTPLPTVSTMHAPHMARPSVVHAPVTAPKAVASITNMTVPTLIYGIVEVRRLQRELEGLEEYLNQAHLRKASTDSTPELPKMSRLMDSLARENHCDLAKAADRQLLNRFMQYLLDSAPTIHMSFATDPSSAFTAKIVSWLRSSIHPHAMLQLGLQPSIAAGCIIRTANKSFDLSLRNRFDGQRDLLSRSLEVPS